MMKARKRYAATNWLCRERKDYARERIRTPVHTLCIFIYQHGMMAWDNLAPRVGQPQQTWGSRLHRPVSGRIRIPRFAQFPPNKAGCGLHDTFGIFSVSLSLLFSLSYPLTHLHASHTSPLLSPMKGLFGNSVKESLSFRTVEQYNLKKL